VYQSCDLVNVVVQPVAVIWDLVELMAEVYSGDKANAAVDQGTLYTQQIVFICVCVLERGQAKFGVLFCCFLSCYISLTGPVC
jgi:hypothetical protein